MSTSSPTVGDLAPEITLVARDGTPWRLAEQRGHTVVAIFHRHIH